MGGAPGIIGGVPSEVPSIILRALSESPLNLDGLVEPTQRKRRTLQYHLARLVASGKIEKVASKKNINQPVYRLKVR